MPSTKLYAAIYVVLFAGATAQIVIERSALFENAYWIAFGGIMVLSFAKAAIVAGWYQHLVHEPRSITYLVLTGLLAALALTFAASYSIL